MKHTVPAGAEQLIGALVPAPLPQPAAAAAPLPILPARHLPTDTHALPVLDLARPDRSGRLSTRAVLKRLGWGPGHRVDVDVAGGALLVASAVNGTNVVGSRGDLALPAAARALCGITVADPVVVVAYPPHAVMVVHPVATVARLIHQHHVDLAAGDAG